MLWHNLDQCPIYPLPMCSSHLSTKKFNEQIHVTNTGETKVCISGLGWNVTPVQAAFLVAIWCKSTDHNQLKQWLNFHAIMQVIPLSHVDLLNSNPLNIQIHKTINLFVLYGHEKLVPHIKNTYCEHLRTGC
jgi:hypothetical protein